jgi:hypothetical protein
MEARRLGAFTFFVVITDATGVGLFAFLAELSSHFSTSSMLLIVPTESTGLIALGL